MVPFLPAHIWSLISYQKVYTEKLLKTSANTQTVWVLTTQWASQLNTGLNSRSRCNTKTVSMLQRPERRNEYGICWVLVKGNAKANVSAA